MPVSLFAMIFPGSSPLTRGTHDTLLDLANYCRFIPAYAGNSSLIHSSLMETTVHPRLRGELASCKCVCSHEHGSSPLTRGTQRHSSRGPYRRWFIPAYAGNSWIQCAAQRCSTVHPRLRGELFIVGVNVKSRVGSSPLTRGTPKRGAPVSGSGRFIPAYAGNSKNCG